MKYYLHPATAARLLAYSRAYRQFRNIGFARQAAQELAAIHVRCHERHNSL